MPKRKEPDLEWNECITAFINQDDDPPPVKHPKRPRDANQLAKLIVDLSTEPEESKSKNGHQSKPSAKN